MDQVASEGAGSQRCGRGDGKVTQSLRSQMTASTTVPVVRPGRVCVLVDGVRFYFCNLSCKSEVSQILQEGP